MPDDTSLFGSLLLGPVYKVLEGQNCVRPWVVVQSRVALVLDRIAASLLVETDLEARG